MALDEFISDLDALLAEAKSAFDGAADVDALEAARVAFLGAKSGRLKDVQKGMGKVDKTQRPAAGKQLNEVKTQITAAFESAQSRLSSTTTETEDATFDPTVPGPFPRLGHAHPVTQTIEALKDIFGRLGFNIAEGPEIEDEWHNFIALNIPASHPARDPLDNFYLATAGKTRGTRAAGDRDLLLRSQTSTVQIRVMEETQPPVRIVSLGRVYRPDEVDETHYPMFHQIEGLMIDRHVTMADLKSVLRMFCSSYLGEDVHVRFRPSFFPFTEPSVEVDMSWHDGWLEMGGAGLVDPKVLRAIGYDP
jgi:phenylalanyl-tRNA synthetase alpha chain